MTKIEWVHQGGDEPSGSLNWDEMTDMERDLELERARERDRERARERDRERARREETIRRYHAAFFRDLQPWYKRDSDFLTWVSIIIWSIIWFTASLNVAIRTEQDVITSLLVISLIMFSWFGTYIMTEFVISGKTFVEVELI